MKRSLFSLCLLTLFTFVLLDSPLAQAQRGGTPGRFSAGAMIGMGQGKMGNGDDVQDRAMIHTPIAAFAGIRVWRKLRIAGQFEYNLIGQSEDPATLNDQNLSGKSTATGLRIDYWDGKQSAGLIYRMNDTFKLDQQSVSGAAVEYKSKGGFQLQYYRQVKKKFGFVIDYTTETFDESLTTKVKWDRISLGVVFTNFSGR